MISEWVFDQGAERYLVKTFEQKMQLQPEIIVLIFTIAFSKIIVNLQHKITRNAENKRDDAIAPIVATSHLAKTFSAIILLSCE